MTAISTRPPTNSASVNCQPSRIQITMPSSITRFVEANWKASALAAEAPFCEQRSWRSRWPRRSTRRRQRRGRWRCAIGRAPSPPSASLDPLRAEPTPARRPRSRSRARAPTTPSRPSTGRSTDPSQMVFEDAHTPRSCCLFTPPIYPLGVRPEVTRPRAGSAVGGFSPGRARARRPLPAPAPCRSRSTGANENRRRDRPQQRERRTDCEDPVHRARKGPHRGVYHGDLTVCKF